MFNKLSKTKTKTRVDSGNYTCRVVGEGDNMAETSFQLTLVGEKLFLTCLLSLVSSFFPNLGNCDFKSHSLNTVLPIHERHKLWPIIYGYTELSGIL